MTEPLPCPFCGEAPSVGPARPDLHGSSWGEVCCENDDCWAKPVVRDGDNTADDRGSDAYKQLAIRRWNTRAPVVPASIHGMPKNCPDCNMSTSGPFCFGIDVLDDGLHCRQCGSWLCD